jgi:hypothetical protein
LANSFIAPHLVIQEDRVVANRENLDQLMGHDYDRGAKAISQSPGCAVAPSGLSAIEMTPKFVGWNVGSVSLRVLMEIREEAEHADHQNEF